jgi:Spy/CpxP family protein refolding chaperone
MMKWCLSMLVLAAMLAGTVVASAQERPGRGERGEQQARAAAAGDVLKMLTAAGVKLTDEQKAKLDAITKKMQKVMEGIQQAEDRRAAFAGAREELTKLRNEAMEVLTPEQRAAVQKWREAQRERTGERQPRAENEGPRKRRPSTETP